MIILLQSVATQFCRLFWHISYCKKQKSNFITKCDRLLLQSASGITKCDKVYYKVRQVLQSVTVITKWDITRTNVLNICQKLSKCWDIAYRYRQSKISTMLDCICKLQDFLIYLPVPNFHFAWCKKIILGFGTQFRTFTTIQGYHVSIRMIYVTHYIQEIKLSFFLFQ